MLSKEVFIIAEAGVNHNGNLATAMTMVEAAAAAGADAVKFQAFSAEDLATQEAPKASYQEAATGNGAQIEMLKKLELGADAHRELLEHCRAMGIEFLSSPFDLKSVDMLCCLGMEIFKIPSGEINNLPYLRKIGSLGKKVILSTGMSDLDEIRKAVEVLTGTGTRKEGITVLHCSTEYPTPDEDVNLRAMLTIKRELGVEVGYSDHTLGIEISIAAAALGATVIEKHFTLDRGMEGPDHKASLEPEELEALVRAVRKTEKAIGSGIKRPTPSEMKNKPVVRKSIVAARDISFGEVFTDANITVKRPEKGLSPMEWDSVIGRPAKRAFRAGEAIEL